MPNSDHYYCSSQDRCITCFHMLLPINHKDADWEAGRHSTVTMSRHLSGKRDAHLSSHSLIIIIVHAHHHH